MANEWANMNWAMASITASANGAGVKPTPNGTSPGFNPTATTSAHTALGTYDITLDAPLADAQCQFDVACRGALGACAQVSSVSDTVKRVVTGIGTTASDAVSFDLTVLFRA